MINKIINSINEVNSFKKIKLRYPIENIIIFTNVRNKFVNNKDLDL